MSLFGLDGSGSGEITYIDGSQLNSESIFFDSGINGGISDLEASLFSEGLLSEGGTMAGENITWYGSMLENLNLPEGLDYEALLEEIFGPEDVDSVDVLNADPDVSTNTFLEPQTMFEPVRTSLSAWYPTEHFTLEVALSGLFCLLGLICNILALVVLKKDPKKGTTVYILSALAITDWLILVYLCLVKVIPFLCVYIDAESCYGPLLEASIYIWPVGCMAQTAMIWLVVLVTVDRYIAICHPLKSATLSTASKAKKAIAIIWVLAVLVNIPRFFYYTDIGNSDPTTRKVSFQSQAATTVPSQIQETDITGLMFSVSPSTGVTNQETSNSILGRETNAAVSPDLEPEHDKLETTNLPGDDEIILVSDTKEYFHELGPIKGSGLLRYFPSSNKALGNTIWYRTIYYIGFSFVFFYIVPMVTLCILNFKLMGAIRKAKITHANLAHKNHQEKKDSHSVTLNIIAVVLVFLVCQTPDFLQVVISYPDLHVDRYAISLVSASATMFMAINSSVNFFIYCLFYKKFRRLLRRFVCLGSLKK